MNKQRRWVVIVLAFLATAGSAPGQPLPHFRQVLFNHQSVNPAYTAIGENRGFFVFLRNQLTGGKPAGYTRMVSIHTPVFNNFIGTGLDILSDRTDTLERFTLFTNYSYELMVSSDLRLRLGGTYGFSSFGQTGSGERNLMGNFGIGAFLYGENGAFSLAIPRLLGTNPGTSDPSDPVTTDQRIFYFGASAFFTLSDAVKIKPSIFYAIPFGLPAGVDLNFMLELKENYRIGLAYRVDGPVGLMAQVRLKNNFRIGIGGNFKSSPGGGKTVTNGDLSLSYDVDIYRRVNRPAFYF